MVRNHTIKATKCSLCLNTKMTQIQLQNNMLSVKDHLKHHEDQHTHVCKETHVIDPKDVYNAFVHWTKSLFLLPDLRTNVLLKK